MKRAMVTWRMPEEVWRLERSVALHGVIKLAVRLILLIAGTAAVGVLLIQQYRPGLLGWRIHILWGFIIFYCLLLGLMSFSLLVKRRQGLHRLDRTHVWFSDKLRSWSSFAAFDIVSHEAMPEHSTLVLYESTGRKQTLILPGDRRDDIILRIAGRHLPLLQDHPERQRLERGVVDPPAWLRLLMVFTGLLFGAAMGLTAAVIGAKILKTWLIVVAFVPNPIWLLVYLFRKKARRDGYAPTMQGWAMAGVMISLLLALTLALLL